MVNLWKFEISFEGDASKKEKGKLSNNKILLK